ncbi:MAG: 2-oxo acid dehydrogenase subunit E2 [Rhodospirillales bacterium]|nr:2-oxo acid dehydrogenase subunit E2 [Rhodospirillales bacterium]MCB9994889.1 2-oxo acid dehydrogenase subunit E2 [Rhodospirillales bacterium]
MSRTVEVIAPRAGEGIQHVKINRILKEKGAVVKEDECVVEIETAKATLEISSPVDGVIGDIFCAENDTVAVGDVLVHVDCGEQKIANNNRFGQKRKKDSYSQKTTPENDNRKTHLPSEQVTLINQMRLSQSKIVSASIETQIQWDFISQIKKSYDENALGYRPSSLDIIIWSVSQCMTEFEKFRGKIVDDRFLEISDPCLIGIAHAQEDDSLKVPVLSVKCGSDFSEVQSGIRSLLGETDSCLPAYHSLSVSDMSSLNVHRGQPVVIYPAVATLFVGTPYYGLDHQKKYVRLSNVVLAFDHQAINGAYAAKFLKKLNTNIRTLAKVMMERRRELNL